MVDNPGFELRREDDGCLVLDVTDWWSPEAEEILDSGKADGLVMGYTGGFKDFDLAFIKEWPLRKVRLIAWSIKDLSPLHRLAPSLENLEVFTAPEAVLDLGRFPNLTHLAADWAQVRDSIGELSNLKDLYLESYKETDFEPLRWNTTIERLRFKDRPSVTSLRGVENLVALKFLGVYGGRRLSDIGALRDVPGDRLDELHLDGCSSIQDLEAVSHLWSLRCLDAADCGEISSLRPVEGLYLLERLWLWGTTKIVDGDLSPIADLQLLRELRLAPRRFYKPSVEYFETLIAERNDKAAQHVENTREERAGPTVANPQQPQRKPLEAGLTNRGRLSLIAPQLVDDLVNASPESRRRAAYVVASTVADHAKLDDLRINKALDLLKQGRTDRELLAQLEKWAEELEEQYFSISEAYENELVEEEETFEPFHRSRAVSIICLALHQNDLYAAIESTFQAVSAFEDGKTILQAVIDRDNPKQAL